jgi:biotin-(acetyl-CoA carboxylase) ligase
LRGLVPGGSGKVHLKWPNDVLVGDGKASGLLIEMDGDRLLLGIGVNVGQVPGAILILLSTTFSEGKKGRQRLIVRPRG